MDGYLRTMGAHHLKIISLSDTLLDHVAKPPSPLLALEDDLHNQS